MRLARGPSPDLGTQRFVIAALARLGPASNCPRGPRSIGARTELPSRLSLDWGTHRIALAALARLGHAPNCPRGPRSIWARSELSRGPPAIWTRISSFAVLARCGPAHVLLRGPRYLWARSTALQVLSQSPPWMLVSLLAGRSSVDSRVFPLRSGSPTWWSPASCVDGLTTACQRVRARTMPPPRPSESTFCS